MASTRNKNTPGNYLLENRQTDNMAQYTIYKHAAHGEAYHTKISGNGLNPGQLPNTALSNNAIDIETFLYGINSTNLVNPAPPLTPKLKQLESAHIFKSRRIIIPEPLVVLNGQRPLPMS